MRTILFLIALFGCSTGWRGNYHFFLKMLFTLDATSILTNSFSNYVSIDRWYELFSSKFFLIYATHSKIYRGLSCNCSLGLVPVHCISFPTRTVLLYTSSYSLSSFVPPFTLSLTENVDFRGGGFYLLQGLTIRSHLNCQTKKNKLFVFFCLSSFH